MKQIEKCRKFLENNGYTEAYKDPQTEWIHFEPMVNAVSCIDLSENEIVFVGDEGDWLHIPCSYYALIGACIHYSQIGIGYKH